MYIGKSHLVQSLDAMTRVHPFHLIVYPMCKKNGLAVGRAAEFDMYGEAHRFLVENFKPDSASKYFYKASRVNNRREWLRHDYASKGLQKDITTTFAGAFVRTGKRQWGWHDDYVATLKSRLVQGQALPAFHMAVWLLRNRSWPRGARASDVVRAFQAEYGIARDEARALFTDDLPVRLDLVDTPPSWDEVRGELRIEPPPDRKPASGGTLALLDVREVGPITALRFEPAVRLNLVTGDNGLGKTLLLDCCWWALSGGWPTHVAAPRRERYAKQPTITFRLSGEAGSHISKFDWKSNRWPYGRRRETLPGLLVYARVDGAFSVLDPAKCFAADATWQSVIGVGPTTFTRDEVWTGKSVATTSGTRFVSNGLYNDWVLWQNDPDQTRFNTLKKVLLRLSPADTQEGDLGPLVPGTPTKIPGDARVFPTLSHSYGEVPLLYASAGVRRIAALAYLVVGTWAEHKQQAEMMQSEPQRRMTMIVDELEAHLHPLWQRRLLPALLDVSDDLQTELSVQFIVATHSPLVLASAEPVFDSRRDKLLHLGLNASHGVDLEELDMMPIGSANSWLTSPAFNLRQPRSVQAEQAMEDAEELLSKAGIVQLEVVSEVHARLSKNLSPYDPFWPRWVTFAERHGMKE